jgi:holo-[acyl-carrier protein] synthase
MIAGLGTDIVSIERVRRVLARHEGRFGRKVLADSEWRVAEGMPDPAPFVAKRFAAKEAFFKALGAPASAANTWHQLAIANEGDGRPCLVFGSALAQLLAVRGITGWHVSLSDEREYAVATIILERVPT